MPISAMARLSFRLFPPDSFAAIVFLWGDRPSLAMMHLAFLLGSRTPLTRA